MNKILFPTLFACLVFLVGCSRESAEERYGLNPQSSLAPIVLKKAESSDGTIVEYTSVNRRLYEMKTTSTTNQSNNVTFQYNGDQVSGFVVRLPNASPSDPPYVVANVLYSGSKISKVTMTMTTASNIIMFYESVYVYNSNGLLTKLTTKRGDTATNLNWYTVGTAHYVGNNISKVTQEQGMIVNGAAQPGVSVPHIMAYESFDSKDSPYSTFKQDAFIAYMAFEPTYMMLGNPNNAISYTALNTSGTVNITYTYNAEGYPISSSLGGTTFTYGGV